MVALTALLCLALIGTVVLGAVALGIGKEGENQTAADLAALAGANKMLTLYPRLFEPVMIDGRYNPNHLAPGPYMAAARASVMKVAKRNGASKVRVTFPDAKGGAPMQIRVVVNDPAEFRINGKSSRTTVTQVAVAELQPLANPALAGPTGSQGEYQGPFAHRQGKPMRPDVAKAFDRMYAAARKEAGISLIITSAYRSSAEQAALFNKNPDPRMVAPPGKSLHRLGTELDLGPNSAYGWLASNANRFGFLKRYSWEPWHFGYIRNTASSSVGYGGKDSSKRTKKSEGKGSSDSDGDKGHPSVPSFVPQRYRGMISEAAQRWNVSAALIAAQLYAESNFNPNARSAVGAQGIAQFMPATAAQYGLTNPFDPKAAIMAQAHMMHDLLKMFGSVPLALAAYNAGPGAVKGCGCIPPYAETRAYVAKIISLMNGLGDISFANGGNGLAVRLVE